ncbi:MAG TPA: peptidyl-alpha-hydroxyglycine alpha-amidating lyase family protein [Acetobacteraceae bacterium]|jgi:DNA-binding beta-propeller fold protein YncE|nr:peptidyl-alpha-hydroxyglycine alpha-amidating lyase family protein [Acetobacteraceae bacterium]
MAIIVGSGEHRYEVIENWGKLPDGWHYGEVAAVGVDSKDNVYVFARSEHPMMVFDREGNFLRSWGEGLFRRPHGVHLAPDDTIYCTDDGDHTVRRLTLEGKLLLEIGVPGEPAPMYGGDPFNRCTHTALSPEGDIYVADGYGNARVHKYSPNGKLQFSWGEPGTDPGAFNVVHNICCDEDGWIYVADRENHRVQVFDGKGKYHAQWNNLHRPCGLCMTRGRNPLAYIGESGPGMAVNAKSPGIGPRVSIVTHEGKPIARLGDATRERASQFIAPHGVAIDSRGDIYVGEVARTAMRNRGTPLAPEQDIRCMQKLVKLG